MRHLCMSSFHGLIWQVLNSNLVQLCMASWDDFSSFLAQIGVDSNHCLGLDMHPCVHAPKVTQFWFKFGKVWKALPWPINWSALAENERGPCPDFTSQLHNLRTKNNLNISLEIGLNIGLKLGWIFQGFIVIFIPLSLCKQEEEKALAIA